MRSLKILLVICVSYLIIYCVEGRGGRGGGGRFGGRSGGYRSGSSYRSSSYRSSSYRSSPSYSSSRSYSSSSSSSYSRSYSSSSSSSSSSRSSSARSPPSTYYSSYSAWSVPKTRKYKVIKPILTRVKASNVETNYATKFSSSTKSRMTGKIPTKVFGLGVGRSTIGGSGYGYGAGLAQYSVYHRYHRYRYLLYTRGYIDDDDWDEDYYSTYYEKKECLDGCPENSHCEWSFCECNPGHTKAWGQCSNTEKPEVTEERLNASITSLSCTYTSSCTPWDINMVCINNKCTCRQDMKWNPKLLECQIFLDVDCSSIDYNTEPSSLVQAAADKTKQGVLRTETPNAINVLDSLFSGQDLLSSKPEDMVKKDEILIVDNRTETIEESLENSLFKYVDTENASEVELTDAFCRDVDAFNEAFQSSTEGKPDTCPAIPATSCAVLYDSARCRGGWKLDAPPGTQKRLLYFSSDWKHRNDVDTIGVRNGCTFVGFTGSSFDGNSMSITAGISDRWIVLNKVSAYKAFHEDIESFQCVCR